MDDHREQLVELEIKLAFQDRQLRELDSLVRTLASRIEATERELGELKKTLQPESAANEPPPHY